MPCDVEHVSDRNTVVVVRHGRVTSEDAVRAAQEASCLLAGKTRQSSWTGVR